MDERKELALKLAHEVETRDRFGMPEAVVERARVYLDFLQGTAATPKTETSEVPLLRWDNGAVWHSWNGGKGWWNGEPVEETKSSYRSKSIP